MEDVLAVSWPVFIGLTLILFGGAALMMGRALADTWRPAWQNVAYGLLLGVGDRLFGNFLFASDVVSLSGYLVHTAVLVAMALLAYRITKVHKMVAQYPWMYQRAGLLSWRKIS